MRKIFKASRLAVLIGIFVGIEFESQVWTPLIRHSSHYDSSYAHIHDKDKRLFFSVLYQTFEAENPKTDRCDDVVDSLYSENELIEYYNKFDKLIKQVRLSGCTTQRIVVPTIWDGDCAADRYFTVFDINHCNANSERK